MGEQIFSQRVDGRTGAQAAHRVEQQRPPAGDQEQGGIGPAEAFADATGQCCDGLDSAVGVYRTRRLPPPGG
jgi:hypothetical protein